LPDYLDDFLQDDAYEKILAIYYACTSENPTKRPSAEAILDILDSEDIWNDTSEAWNFLLMEYEKEKGMEKPLDFDCSINEQSVISDVISEINSEFCNSNCNHSDDSVLELLSNEDSTEVLETKDKSVIEISEDESIVINSVDIEKEDDKCIDNHSDSICQLNEVSSSSNNNQSSNKNDADEVNKWLEATLNLSKSVNLETLTSTKYSESESAADDTIIKTEELNNVKYDDTVLCNVVSNDKNGKNYEIAEVKNEPSEDQKHEVNRWIETSLDLSKRMIYEKQTTDIEIKKESDVKSFEASDKAMAELPNVDIDNHIDQDANQVFSKSMRDTEKFEVDKWLEQTFNLSKIKTSNDSLNISCDIDDATMVKIEKVNDSNKCSNEHNLDKSNEYSSDENNKDESDDSNRNAGDVKFKEFEAVLNG